MTLLLHNIFRILYKWRLFTGILALDIWSKQWIISNGFADNPKCLLPFVTIVLAWNEGVSFGMLSGAPWMPVMVFWGTTVLILALMVYWFSLKQADQKYALTIILAGAIGNWIDRVRFGAVIDFISLHVGSFYWPAFNVADSAITLGAAWFVWIEFQKERKAQ